MPEPEPSPAVGPGESIARHCRNRSHIAGGGKVKYSAFMPPPNLRLSVVRRDGLNEQEVESIGRQYVDKDVKGHATLPAAAIRARNLTFDPNGEPFSRHANVLGWDDDDARNRLAASALAEASVLTKY